MTPAISLLTLLQVCQSHWKGLALGSFSTNSMTSILILFTTLASPSGFVENEHYQRREGVDIERRKVCRVAEEMLERDQ